MALSCKLTTPELLERKRTVIHELKNLVVGKTELESGYRYCFKGDDATLDLINSFIKTERMCCDFFNFNLRVTSDGFAELELTGPEGTREFIRRELSF